MVRELNRENAIELALKSAVKNEEFDMVYQPQYHLKTGRMIGMEALIRWTSPVFWVVPPMEFIPIAEKSSLMVDIGDWILQKVFSDLALLKTNARWIGEDFRCVVNVSSVQMADGRFSEKLFKAMETHGVDGSWIELELTARLFFHMRPNRSISLKQYGKRASPPRLTILVRDIPPCRTCIRCRLT